MKIESQVLLIDKYPTLYTDDCQDAEETVKQRGFYCGEGWFTMIDTLSELIVERSPTCIATLATEAGGTLEFDIINFKEEDCDYLFGLINFAHCLSRQICCVCGKQGWMFNSSSMIALCADHCHDTYKSIVPEACIPIPTIIQSTGTMWHQMIINLLQETLFHQRENEMPVVDFEPPFKNNGQLQISYRGGNEVTDGMTDLLVAYAKKVDEETGEIINISKQFN